ncbi:hypothetical protein GE21DRAFT_1219150 [Neurospora crassa]|nr:hypothetical protein GE21DRAFT_1219150 [Neurospora crassa]
MDLGRINYIFIYEITRILCSVGKGSGCSAGNAECRCKYRCRCKCKYRCRCKCKCRCRGRRRSYLTVERGVIVRVHSLRITVGELYFAVVRERTIVIVRELYYNYKAVLGWASKLISSLLLLYYPDTKIIRIIGIGPD